MNSKNVLLEALKLSPEEKILLVDGILRSLDEPDLEIDAIWADEAEKRLAAYRAGNLKGIRMEEILKDEE